MQATTPKLEQFQPLAAFPPTYTPGIISHRPCGLVQEIEKTFPFPIVCREGIHCRSFFFFALFVFITYNIYYTLLKLLTSH